MTRTSPCGCGWRRRRFDVRRRWLVRVSRPGLCRPGRLGPPASRRGRFQAVAWLIVTTAAETVSTARGGTFCRVANGVPAARLWRGGVRSGRQEPTSHGGQPQRSVAPCHHWRMPELPEVEAVRRELAPAMLQSRIVRVLLRRQNLRRPFPAGFASRLEGQTIDSIDRRGKYLLVRVTSGETLLMHLGMSGSFRVDARSRRRDRWSWQLASRSSRPRCLRAVEWLDRDLQRSAAVRRDGSDRGRAVRRPRSASRARSRAPRRSF